MIRTRTICIVGIVLCVGGSLLATGTGCSPTGSSVPSTTKPADKKPDNKPSHHEPDVG